MLLNKEKCCQEPLEDVLVDMSMSKKENAIQLRYDGLSLSKIATKLSISFRTAKKYCESVPFTKEQQVKNLYRNPNKRVLAVKYRNNGMSMGEIAKQLGVAKSSISKWMKEEANNILLSVKQRKEQNDLLLKKQKESILNDVIKYRFQGYGCKEIGEIFNKTPEFIISVCKLYSFTNDDKNTIKIAVEKRTNERRKRGELKPVGGFRKGAERSKSGYYKGIYSSSTYELCWIVYNLDMGKDVKRFDGFLECSDENFKYYPDFIEDNNHIIEIKGYEDKNVARKTALAERLGYKVTLLKRQDLQHVFEYVDKTYNVNKKSRHSLYDNYKPKFLLVCSECNKDFEVFQLRKRHKDGLPSYCSMSCSAIARCKNKQNK